MPGQSYKILFTADFHARREHFEDALIAGRNEKVNAFVFGGDMVSAKGKYFSHYEFVKSQKNFINNFLIPFLKEVKSNGTEIYFMMGNDDCKCNLDLFRKINDDGLARLLCDDKQSFVYELAGGIKISGYGYVAPTPFDRIIKEWEKWDYDGAWEKFLAFGPWIKTKGWKSTDERGEMKIEEIDLMNQHEALSKDLERLALLTEKPEKTIYAIHDSPRETNLDVVSRGHTGSIAVRDFIQKYSPLATLHGHIHESPWLTGIFGEEIGKTWSFNCGKQFIVFDIFDIKNYAVVENEFKGRIRTVAVGEDGYKNKYLAKPL
ncbi:hypothetical protein COS75_02230 [Candidatus Pacearchaeota archaeon CG06_land_8_20_14_3_00_35_12]|nr:MAG: hypothetical protein COS75_02230 [Candidatus Pacearchaeota archaeon CG06_land_8_20_14_3_00_35_12]